MEARNLHLEAALKEYITQKDLANFKLLFNFMLETSPDSRNMIDEEGKSFLFHALELNAFKIAHELIEIQQHDEKIIFAKDNQQRSLCRIAASAGDAESVKRLLEIAAEKEKTLEFLTSDSHGCSILHNAVQNTSYTRNNIIENILSFASKHFDLKTYVNLTDNEGNTALHLAVYSEKTVSMLCDAGTDLDLINNQGVSFASRFSDMDIDAQTIIFSALKKAHQEILLQNYEEYLKEIIFDGDKAKAETLKNNLFMLAGLFNLQFLLAYHIKYPSETFTFTDKNNLQTILKTKNFPNATKSILIETLIDDEDFEINPDDSIQAIVKMRKSLDDYSIAMDKKSHSVPKRVFILFVIVTFIGCFTEDADYLISQMRKINYANASLTTRKLESAGLIIGMTVSIGLFIAMVFFGIGPISRKFDEKPTLFPDEWKSLFEELENLLIQLRDPDIRQSSEKNLDDLENTINNVTNDRWVIPGTSLGINSFWQSHVKIQADVNTAREVVRKIHLDMNRSTLPLFKPAPDLKNNSDTIVDIGNVNEDEIPLLTLPIKDDGRFDRDYSSDSSLDI